MVALNVAVVAVAATVTEAGAVNVALLLVMVTVAPAAGAAAESVTVQVLEAFAPSDVGLQVTDDTDTAGTRLIVACLEVEL